MCPARDCIIESVKHDQVKLTTGASHRRTQNFLWCALFRQKVDDLLLVVLNTQAKAAKLTTPPSKPTPPSKKFLKMTSCSAWGRIYNCNNYKLRQKIFLALGGRGGGVHVHRVHLPPATTMGLVNSNSYTYLSRTLTMAYRLYWT